MSEKKDTLGYVRVSTREQADSGLSIASQERRIKTYCELNDLNLIEINVPTQKTLKQQKTRQNHPRK